MAITTQSDLQLIDNLVRSGWVSTLQVLTVAECQERSHWLAATLGEQYTSYRDWGSWAAVVHITQNGQLPGTKTYRVILAFERPADYTMYLLRWGTGRD